MATTSLREKFRDLYFGDGPEARRFRYGLVAFDIATIGVFLLAPFGNEMVSKASLNVKQNPVWEAYSTIVMILYLPFGVVFVILNAIQVFALCFSIVGIPVALVIAKSLGTVLNPVNKVCVPSAVAEEMARRNASAALDRRAG